MTQQYDEERFAAAGREQRSAESIPDLIRDLATDLSLLVGKEIQLAKSEVRETVAEVQTGVGAIATGAVIAMAGLVILLLSAVYGLSNIFEPWLAALIVGAAALLLGFLMVQGARKKISETSVLPERTVESVKKDTSTLKRASR
ncbi:MAG: phage holin family protein [Pseudohongiella sp.]|nr:phage holin family protein [Pseudohongiella sp.]MDP2128485.1 phage holin family protein [Pseudohongiella sp.]